MNNLRYKFCNRTYIADIQTEPETTDNEYNLEELPHTASPPFNPYRESKNQVQYSIYK